jgi:hypothetical protein
MKKTLFISLSLITGILIFLLSCKSEKKPEILENDILQPIVRFDKILLEMDTSNMRAEFDTLAKQYPYFMDVYFLNVLPIPGYESKTDSFFILLKGFINDPATREVARLVNKQYVDFNAETDDLIGAFNNAKTWFPEIKTPNIYTFISEFSYQRFIFEDGEKDGLAIGLDLFLGKDFEYARLEQGTNTFANYLTRSFDSDHLLKKTMDAWIEDQMGLQSGNRLIDHMAYNGKKLYLLDQIIEENDSILLEYSAKQMDWLKNNELELWSFFFENDWFYTTDQYVVKRLVYPAPNTTAIGMPAAAPGNTGTYLGYKIVQSYMKRYPETDFKTLMSIDGQQLLELSKFKPARN